MQPQPQVVTVSQVADYLRLLVESDAFLANLWVEGEVSNVYLSRPGHLYFTLGDGNASIKAVAFRASALRIQSFVTDGAHLVVGGRISVYNRDATCQIYVDYAASSGIGIQALALARLRAQLETEGLFDPTRKRPLPAFPTRIAVVTSPTGAVIHDIQTVLRRRFPLATLIVSPAQVQGAGAVDSLISALDLVLREADADLVIVARGGGSAEDLSAFNDERLARLVFAYPLPVISAIGHETDVSILDEVADLRAPTPTAAAELATPDIADLALEVLDTRDRLRRNVATAMVMRRFELDQAIQRVDRSSPLAVLTRHRDRLEVDRGRMRVAAIGRVRLGQHEGRMDNLRLSAAGLRIVDRQKASVTAGCERLRTVIAARFADERADLEISQTRLAERNPRTLLRRGYSILTDRAGNVVDSIGAIGPGSGIRATVQDGTIWADVTEVRPEGA